MSEPQGTGDCFQTAAWIVVYGNEFGDANKLWLCHAKVSRPEDGLRHSHTWVEVEQLVDVPGWTHPVLIRDCIDRANGHDARLPRGLYYNVGKIDEDSVRRYTPEEAGVWLKRTEQWGPWEEL